MIIFEYLGAYVMHIIFKERRINLGNEAKGAFLLEIHMGKRVRKSMTLKQETYL